MTTTELTTEQMLQQIEQTKQEWLDQNAEYQHLRQQHQRNERSLEAARQQYESLSAEWRGKAHSSGLKASGEARSLLEESMAARTEAHHLELLVEEGPAVLAEKAEEAEVAKLRYYDTVRKYQAPIMKDRLEKARAAILDAPGLAEAMEVLSQYIAAVKHHHMEKSKLQIGYHEFDAWGLVGSDDMELILDFTRNRINREEVVPFLESIGLNMNAALPEELQPPEL
jgi:predicted  nucleic acid-binding Zn-ribbon protein